MVKLEDMMKKDGWKAGYYINWGVKYFSFRKDNLEIDWNDIHDIYPEKETTQFKPWVEDKK